MKESSQSLLVTLLLTTILGLAFWVFEQGTFFTPLINHITEGSLFLLLAMIWLLFFRSLLPQRHTIYPVEERPLPEDSVAKPIPSAPEKPQQQPEAANGEETVFFPPS